MKTLTLLSVLIAPHAHVPQTTPIMCTAVQVCGECPTPPQCYPDGRGGQFCTGGGTHQCGCHMECLPGTEGR